MSAYTYRELTVRQFLARCTAVPNHISPYGAFDGCMSETFGEELVYVQAHDPNLVWTVLESDGRISIVSGLRFVNRFGYLIVGAPVETGHTDNVASDDHA